MGQKSIEASPTFAVCTFNGGELALASVLDSMFSVPSYNTLIYLTRRDQKRYSNREWSILQTQKHAGVN